MHPLQLRNLLETRRHFLQSTGLSLGGAALAGLLGKTAGSGEPVRNIIGGQPDIQALAAKARHVIYLFQSGGPSQLDLYDYKPHLTAQLGKDLPASVRMGQRLTGFTNKQASLPIAPSVFKFNQHGDSGAWLSETLPCLGQVADEICFLKSVHSEAINHDPAAC